MQVKITDNQKDTRGNATGSKILSVGISNNDKLMSWQMLTSNDGKKTHKWNKTKLYGDERREGEDLKLNTQKTLKETQTKLSTTFSGRLFF